MPIRRTWSELRVSADYQGRWVALDKVTFDGKTDRPVEATVVDSDENLVALCTRMRRADMHHCTVVYCDDEPPPSSARARIAPPVEEKERPSVRLH